MQIRYKSFGSQLKQSKSGQALSQTGRYNNGHEKERLPTLPDDVEPLKQMLLERDKRHLPRIRNAHTLRGESD